MIRHFGDKSFLVNHCNVADTCTETRSREKYIHEDIKLFGLFSTFQSIPVVVVLFMIYLVFFASSTERKWSSAAQNKWNLTLTDRNWADTERSSDEELSDPPSLKHRANQSNTALPQRLQSTHQWVSEWAGFNISMNTVYVIWETVLQVKRPNQQYQSTEGRQK